MILSKFRITIKSIIIFLVLISNNPSFGSEIRKTLVIAGDYWCPYNCNPTSDKPGFLIDLARHALRIYDLEIEYRIMPWSEALRQLEEGKIDGIVGVTEIKDKDLVTTHVPLEFSVCESFTRTDTEWVYDGFSSLQHKKIGIVMGYNLDEFISNYIAMNYISNPEMFVIEEEINSVANSFNNLINQKIDIYIEDQKVARHYIEENKLTNKIRSGGLVNNSKVPLYIGFSAKIPHIKKYIEYLEEGIASLKATGQYDHLKRLYGIENITP